MLRLRLIQYINRLAPKSNCPETKDRIFMLDVVPIKMIDDDDNIVKIIGDKCTVTPNDIAEQFHIDKLYFTDDARTLLIDCIDKSLRIKMACAQYRYSNNILSKMYKTWKVIEIHNPISNKRIQFDRHSKIF